MEVIPYLNKTRQGFASILHVCGGDPNLYEAYMQSKKVFSTYVEVILMAFLLCIIANCILHVCGGDPSITISKNAALEYSPRMWR